MDNSKYDNRTRALLETFSFDDNDQESEESFYSANNDIVPIEDVYLMFIEYLQGRKITIKGFDHIKEYLKIQDDSEYGRKIEFTDNAYTKVSEIILEKLSDVDVQYLIEFIDICKISYFPYSIDFRVHIIPSMKNGKLYFPKCLKRLNIVFNDLYSAEDSKLEVHMNKDMIDNSSMCYIGEQQLGVITSDIDGETYGNITFAVD